MTRPMIRRVKARTVTTLLAALGILGCGTDFSDLTLGVATHSDALSDDYDFFTESASYGFLTGVAPANSVSEADAAFGARAQRFLQEAQDDFYQTAMPWINDEPSWRTQDEYSYISTFEGQNCTGTERYYRPYFNWTYNCRPYTDPQPVISGSYVVYKDPYEDNTYKVSRPVCGTTLRRVTNRSYKYQGVCYNAWPSGFEQDNYVTVYRPGQDRDYPLSLAAAWATASMSQKDKIVGWLLSRKPLELASQLKDYDMTQMNLVAFAKEFISELFSWPCTGPHCAGAANIYLHIIRNLVASGPQYNGDYFSKTFDCGLANGAFFTENHMAMTNFHRFLIMHEMGCSDSAIASRRRDAIDFIRRLIRQQAQNGEITPIVHEYNATWYSTFTANAVHVLHEYTNDAMVKAWAKAYLDYHMMKLAVQTNQGRRVPAHCRHSVQEQYNQMARDRLFSSSSGDSEIARQMLYAGNYHVLPNLDNDPGAYYDGNSSGLSAAIKLLSSDVNSAANWGVLGALGTYRPHPQIMRWLVGACTNGTCTKPYAGVQKFGHHNGYEAYFHSPSFTLTYGGPYNDVAITGWDYKVKSYPRVSTLMPTVAPGRTTPPYGVHVSDFIQFVPMPKRVDLDNIVENGPWFHQQLWSAVKSNWTYFDRAPREFGSSDVNNWFEARNPMCLTHNFMCGFNPRLPDSWSCRELISGNGGTWTFINGPACGLDFYAAVFVGSFNAGGDCSGGCPQGFGFVEAQEAADFGYSYTTFRNQVLSYNSGRTFRAGVNTSNVYTRTRGGNVYFAMDIDSMAHNMISYDNGWVVDAPPAQQATGSFVSNNSGNILVRCLESPATTCLTIDASAPPGGYYNVWPTWIEASTSCPAGASPAQPCGEACCYDADGANYISLYAGANCTGQEYYYTPYFGGSRCRPHDAGTFRCGATKMTVTRGSYKYAGACYNQTYTNSDMVRVYR